MSMSKPLQKVILLSGQAGSGKDTVASYISSRYGYARVAFATPMYRMLARMYAFIPDISPSYIEQHKAEEAPYAYMTWRELLQTLGTEWGRNIVHKDIWAYIALAGTTSFAPQSVVISDARFPNEIEIFTGKHGRNVGIFARHVALVRDSLGQVMDHESEKHIKQMRESADYVLENNGTLADLWSAVDIMMQRFDIQDAR